MSKIFVYGSLRRGGALNNVLQGSEFLFSCRTKPEYSLFSLGKFPALIHLGNTAVLGEVYEISDNVLQLLDSIEGHPYVYLRTPIYLENNLEIEGYLFSSWIPSYINLIKSGDWIEFHYDEDKGS